ncbi:MAG: dihydroorotase [Alphaproteobacteria bacterium]|jgi:dihydroorotase|nr:dihydroorotase [Alphaproteobacteria bacterium]
MTAYDLIIRGATLVNHDGIGPGDVAVKDGRTAAIGDLGQAEGAQVIDADGLHLLPGVIDTQVHFREPGAEHKEDLEFGSRAAVLGGVTAVFEMPNTRPNTSTPEAIADKLRRAEGRMWCDHAFYVGATAENADQLGELERLPGTAGVKIFMGASTGDLLVADDENLARVLRSIRRRCAVHAEDEFRMQERHHIAEAAGRPHAHPDWRDAQSALLATQRLIGLAREIGRRVHVLHITTAAEIEFLGRHRDIATVEVTPQHLTLTAPDCYDRLGTLAQMNPPIRDAAEQAGLWLGVAQGIVDVVGSDHAPHGREEKAAIYPASPSGMPGVQTLLPILLDHAAHGRLTLSRLVDLTSAGAARIFGIAAKGRLGVGYDADYTLVDLAAERTIEDDWIASKCGWTPFSGQRVRGWPKLTVIRGRVVMAEDELVGKADGRPLRFWETIDAA